MKELEIWKDIAGYEARYQVSNFGAIRRLSCYTAHNLLLKPKLLKIGTNNNGNYSTVTLRDGRFLVHRLAQAFVENTHNYLEVNHLDGNKQNNHYTNLVWCTRSENVLHAFRTGLKFPKIGVDQVHSKLDGLQVKTIKSLLKTGGVKQTQIAAYFKVQRSTISDIVHNRTWTHVY